MTRNRKTTIERLALYGGVVAVVFEWAAVIAFYLQAPEFFDGRHPISYFASLPETRHLFILFYMGAVISFSFFIFGHLRKKYSIPTFSFAASMVFAITTALLPYDPLSTASKDVHDIFARLTAAAFILGVLTTSLRSRQRSFRITGFAIAFISFIFALSVAFFEGKNGVFMAEVLTFLSLQYWTVWITFKSFGEDARKK